MFLEPEVEPEGWLESERSRVARLTLLSNMNVTLSYELQTSDIHLMAVLTHRTFFQRHMTFFQLAK